MRRQSPGIGNENGETSTRIELIHKGRVIFAANGLLIVNGRLTGVLTASLGSVAGIIAAAAFNDIAIAIEHRMQIGRASWTAQAAFASPIKKNIAARARACAAAPARTACSAAIVIESAVVWGGVAGLNRRGTGGGHKGQE